jgi:hypothetical protein
MTVSLNQITTAAGLIACAFSGMDLALFTNRKERIAQGAMQSKMDANAIVEIAWAVARDKVTNDELIDFCRDMALGGEEYGTKQGRQLKMSDEEVDVLVRWGMNFLQVSRGVLVGDWESNLRASHSLLLMLLSPGDQRRYRAELNACSTSAAQAA